MATQTRERGAQAQAGGNSSRRCSHEQVRVWSPPETPGLHLMRASFKTQTFARHSHEGYGVGVIEQGALGFSYRGAGLVAGSGSINTVNPDEAHTGHAASEHGWTYRMFYFTPAFLERVAEDVAGRRAPLPFFTSGVIHDPGLAGLLLRAHALFDVSAGGTADETEGGAAEAAPDARLARDTLLLTAFAQLLGRHTYERLPLQRAGQEHAAVARVKEHLRSRFEADANLPNLCLSDLANVACLSPYHFIRVFSRHTGLTPHAWLMQLRARKARELLRQGAAIADAAAQAGFADQSHLTKAFKRLLGYTPGHFRNSVQGA
ncbi:MAG: AraC family transcriptional regulator [Desulfovibrio sp.]